MCTIEKLGQVFVLTLTGDGEHRLSLDLISRIRCSLVRVRTLSRVSPCSALVTRASGNYFCNGFDLSFVNAAESSLASYKSLQSLIDGLISISAELMSLPMPTICAVTGEASAIGFMLAFSHDYIAMNGDHGFISMSELDSLVFPRYILSLMKAKVKHPGVFKDLVLHSKKVPAREAREKGVVDLMKETAGETVEAAIELGQLLAKNNWDGNMYASMRMRAFPEVCRAVGLPEDNGDEW